MSPSTRALYGIMRNVIRRAPWKLSQMILKKNTDLHNLHSLFHHIKSTRFLEIVSLLFCMKNMASKHSPTMRSFLKEFSLKFWYTEGVKAQERLIVSFRQWFQACIIIFHLFCTIQRENLQILAAIKYSLYFLTRLFGAAFAWMILQSKDFGVRVFQANHMWCGT